MDSRSVDTFIFIGTAIRFLQDIDEGFTTPGFGGVIDNYDRLLSWLEDNRLHVSLRAARLNLEEVMNELRQAEILEDGRVRVSDDQAERIANGSGLTAQTLRAETEDFVAYVVTDKRYPVGRLLTSPGELMAPDVFDSLLPIAQYDFRHACRAIAFELPTAAAFHLMRGTEDVLRLYYCSIVKQKRVKPLLWGPMVAGLRIRKAGAPPPVLLNNLDNLRLSFRNPTQHPEKIYDIDEVQDLLSLCIDVINRMIKHMKSCGLLSTGP